MTPTALEVVCLCCFTAHSSLVLRKFDMLGLCCMVVTARAAAAARAATFRRAAASLQHTQNTRTATINLLQQNVDSLRSKARFTLRRFAQCSRRFYFRSSASFREHPLTHLIFSTRSQTRTTTLPTRRRKKAKASRKEQKRPAHPPSNPEAVPALRNVTRRLRGKLTRSK